jgi:large subunit ribosomal protein L29
MEAEELRSLSTAEVLQKRHELIEEIFHLKLKRATSQLENPMKLRQARRDLARIETVLQQRSEKQ